MNISSFFAAMFVAICYTSWPNLGKSLNVNSGLVAFVVVSIALIVVSIISFKDLSGLLLLSRKAVIWILVISIANGLAIYIQANFAANEEVQTGMFLVAIFVMQVVAAPVIDWLVNGILPTTRQFLGLSLSIPALFLISK